MRAIVVVLRAQRPWGEVDAAAEKGRHRAYVDIYGSDTVAACSGDAGRNRDETMKACNVKSRIWSSGNGSTNTTIVVVFVATSKQSLVVIDSVR